MSALAVAVRPLSVSNTNVFWLIMPPSRARSVRIHTKRKTTKRAASGSKKDRFNRYEKPRMSKRRPRAISSDYVESERTSDSGMSYLVILNFVDELVFMVY